MRSGDGWTSCGLGHRHWGLYGAAGVFLLAGPEPDAPLALQLRAGWSHHGGTWGLPGGARDADESAREGALREAAEETTVPIDRVVVEATLVDDHGGWSYTTVVGRIDEPVPLAPLSAESDAVEWVQRAAVDDRLLHQGFAHTWPVLRELTPTPALVVDAANVMGSRPDGWWRDRAGAARRLRDELAAALDGDGLRLPGDPDGVRRFPATALVVEGAARGVGSVAGVESIGAPASGDDTIVEVAAARAGERPVLVITADRELRRRVEAIGAGVLGPQSLWAALGPA